MTEPANRGARLQNVATGEKTILIAHWLPCLGARSKYKPNFRLKLFHRGPAPQARRMTGQAIIPRDRPGRPFSPVHRLLEISTAAANSTRLVGNMFCSRCNDPLDIPHDQGMLCRPWVYWWARVVSNHRPLPCEGSALPLSYAPDRGCRIKLNMRAAESNEKCCRRSKKCIVRHQSPTRLDNSG